MYFTSYSARAYKFWKNVNVQLAFSVKIWCCYSTWRKLAQPFIMVQLCTTHFTWHTFRRYACSTWLYTGIFNFGECFIWKLYFQRTLFLIKWWDFSDKHNNNEFLFNLLVSNSSIIILKTPPPNSILKKDRVINQNKVHYILHGIFHYNKQETHGTHR